MRHDALRGQLKRARQQKALSQAALAARSGASRVTIARLESGARQDLRVGTIARLCEALDLELSALPAGGQAAHETLLARERTRARTLERRLAHVLIAARLLASPRAEAGALVARASRVVDLWQRERLCSPHYVSRWRAMLRGPREHVARALLEPGAWGDALFQNTPWSFAFGPRAR